MPTSITRITVESYDKWRPFFDDLADMREQYGGQGGQIFVNPDNANELLSC